MLEWSPEELRRLQVGQDEIKARLFAHNLAFQYFDANVCKEGELIHEYASGKKELWDFSGKTTPFIIKVLIS